MVFQSTHSSTNPRIWSVPDAWVFSFCAAFIIVFCTEISKICAENCIKFSSSFPLSLAAQQVLIFRILCVTRNLRTDKTGQDITEPNITLVCLHLRPHLKKIFPSSTLRRTSQELYAILMVDKFTPRSQGGVYDCISVFPCIPSLLPCHEKHPTNIPFPPSFLCVWTISEKIARKF